MNLEMNEDIAKKAVAAFCATTGLKGKYVNGCFVIDHCGVKFKFKLTTMARAVDKAAIGMLRLEGGFDERILVARHVYPGQADLLRQFGITFIDTAGNVFIDRPPMYLYVKGCRPLARNENKPVRAFKKTGLKIIFAFLCNPGLENKTCREIAGFANVALGAVGRVMDELEEKGYLRRRGKRCCKLVRKDELLKRWVTAYHEQLRGGLILDRYAFDDIRKFAKENTPDEFGAMWGGELGAEKLVGYLTARQVDVYVKGRIDEVALKLRLRKDENGNATLLKRFWNFECDNPQRVVPPILLYADLLATGVERDIETAEKIYEELIKTIID